MSKDKRLDDYELEAKIQKVLDGTDPIPFPDRGIVPAERTKVIAPFNEFKAALLVGGDHVAGDRTPAQTHTKIQKRVVLEPIFNHFQKINVKDNSLISDDLKILWGVHIDSDVRHVIGEGPHEYPVVVEKDMNTPLHIKLRIKSNTSTGSFAHPADVSRCDGFVYLFPNPGTPPVPTPEPTSEGQFVKRTETNDDWIDFAFTLAEKGMRVKILLQYFNAKGHGVSSEILDTIIP